MLNYSKSTMEIYLRDNLSSNSWRRLKFQQYYGIMISNRKNNRSNAAAYLCESKIVCIIIGEYGKYYYEHKLM